MRNNNVNTPPPPPPVLVFGDGSVPISSVNFSILANMIAKMCDGPQNDIIEHASANANADDDDVVLQSLLSLLYTSSSSSSSLSLPENT